MSWHTYYEGDKVAVTIDGITHWMDPESIRQLADSMRRQHEYAMREKTRRASEAAQAKAKQENARHE